LEKTRKWRWGVHRWFVLLFIVLGIIGVKLYPPVQPHIQVAAEKLSETPLFTIPGIGPIYLVNTFTSMLVSMLVIILVAYAVKRAIGKGDLVPDGIAGAIEMLIEVMYNLTENTTGAKWAKKVFPWFATIMIVVLVANIVKLLPGFETIGLLHHSEKGYAIKELFSGVATVLPQEGAYVVTPFFRAQATDLNFTLSLALISVIMTQVIGLQAQGLGYFSKFFNTRNLFTKPFFGAMDFLVGLLETISEFAKILSFTFRLFGNMFAGVVLLALIGVMLPVFMPSFVMLFEVFIGLIQAFVFGMLTMVFMSMATRGHGGEEHAAEH